MKNFLYEYPLDSLLTTDEWDHVRYLIGEWLKSCEVESGLNPVRLPLILYFKGKMKDKLIKAGFDKEALDNPEELELILKELDTQGIKYYHPKWRYNPPYGFPTGSFTLSSDNCILWVKPDIDAALRALESITIIKGLLVNNGLVNKEAIKVYLRSLELTINLSRAGIFPEFARAEAEKREKSMTTRELKKKVMRRAIKHIFEKNPKMDKTLGYVWNKFDVMNKNIRFMDKETGKKYKVKTGKDSKGDIVIITGDGIKPLKYKYLKRTLQHFIDELK